MAMIDTREGPVYQVSAPSNIAFAKYWGKSDSATQWPANDSLSMTLEHARANTAVQLGPEGSDDVLIFEDLVVNKGEGPGQKVFRHLDWLRTELGFTASLRVQTSNTFPKSCGIASSAAGMAALTLAAVSAWTGSPDLAALESAGYSRERLADLARMGSGSASRSLHGGFVWWQRGEDATSQKFTQMADETHWQLADIIVVVSGEPKSVGSTEAHELAWTSPLFAPRLAGHTERLISMQQAIADRDLATLGPLLETEALEMHSVAMTSEPPITYINDETVKVLSWIRNERRSGGVQAYFTLDAGCNVHVITEEGEKFSEAVTRQFPHAELIVDRVGSGPTLELRL